MSHVPVSSAPVNSTLIAGVAYEANSTLLQLEFRDGSRHGYFGVPEEVYEGLIAAPSKGIYFNRWIRGSYRHTQLRRSD